MTHPLPPLVAERLRALRERPAEPTDKGFGYPMLTLRESALAGNLAAMAAYCAGAGVELAPHGKTAMSPELAARQLASGAWGITVATIGQLRVYRAFGFPRLLLANELVDERGHRLAGGRAGRRSRLRGVLLCRQHRRRGHPGPGPHGAPGRAQAPGPGGDRPGADRLPDR